MTFIKNIKEAYKALKGESAHASYESAHIAFKDSITGNKLPLDLSYRLALEQARAEAENARKKKRSAIIFPESNFIVASDSVNAVSIEKTSPKEVVVCFGAGSVFSLSLESSERAAEVVSTIRKVCFGDGLFIAGTKEDEIKYAEDDTVIAFKS